jgi:threonine synthase
MKAVIFIGSGKISYGKLSQALDYGALTVQIAGDFDDAMARVKEVARKLGIYLVNSVNPFRLEGQKTIMYRVLEALRWEVPDWIVVPGGNLGNSSAFGKAFRTERAGADRPHAAAGGDQRRRRQHAVRAVREAAAALERRHGRHGIIEYYYARWTRGPPRPRHDRQRHRDQPPGEPDEVPAGARVCDGVVREVSDQEILDAKAQVGAGGFGCEPASAASVAGAKCCARRVIAPTTASSAS